MKLIKKIFYSFTSREKKCFIVAFIVFFLSCFTSVGLAIKDKSQVVPVEGGSFKEGIIGQPIAINPVISSNPVDEDISALVYSRLFPMLQSYDVSQGGRLYTLKLKEGLKWDDGEPLTSDDVVFTINAIQDSESRSPLAKNFQGAIVERQSQIQIQLTLPAPYVFFLDNIKNLSIIPRHIFGSIPFANLRLSSYNLEPVGSGPYRFKDFSKRKDGFITEYHLVRNESFFGQKPFIKDFYFEFFENQDGVLSALKYRRIQGFGSLNPLDAKIESLGSVAVNKIPMPRYYAVFFNQNNNSLLKEKKFRLALSYAVDRNRIIKEVFDGEAKEVYGPFLNSFQNEESIESGYKPDEAKALFNDVVLNKKIDKAELKIIVPKVDFLEKAAQIIKEEWLVLGVDRVEIISLNPKEMLNEAVKLNNYEMILFGNISENPNDLFPFWHSSQRFYPGLNLALYKNPEVDSLIETIRESKDSDESRLGEDLKNLESLILEDAPAIFLFSLSYTYIHDKILEGFGANQIIEASDRFRGISDWNLLRARVIK